jgi:hypothetical protein
MTTDKGFLVAGLDGHVVGLGIGRNELRKNGETLTIFFVHNHFIVDSWSKLLMKVYQAFAHAFPLQSLTLLHSFTVFLNFHLLDFLQQFSHPH